MLRVKYGNDGIDGIKIYCGHRPIPCEIDRIVNCLSISDCFSAICRKWKRSTWLLLFWKGDAFNVKLSRYPSLSSVVTRDPTKMKILNSMHLILLLFWLHLQHGLSLPVHTCGTYQQCAVSSIGSWITAVLLFSSRYILAAYRMLLERVSTNIA